MNDETGPGVPSDIDAERAVIGAVIAAGVHSVDDSAAAAAAAFGEAVRAGVSAGAFWRTEHEALWHALAALVDARAPVDLLSVTGALAKAGDLSKAGGPASVAALIRDAPPAASIEYHAATVREYAVSRALVQAGDRIKDLGWSTNAGDAQTRVAAAMAAVEDAAASARGVGQSPSWSTLTEIWRAVNDETARRSDPTSPDDGIMWGYADLDAELAPLRPGDLAVITAYSGGGKSVMTANLAFHASQRQGRRCLVHALEMSRLEIGQRWASMLHGIPLSAIVRGNLHWGQRASVEETHLLTADSDHLIVDESAHLSLAQLRASVREHKPDLVVVDQLPLMTPPDARAPREQQMSTLAYGLKTIAKDEQVIVVAATQLNADAMKRNNRRPTMHDMRESKAIAHASDWVIALWDPVEASGEAEDPRVGEMDLLILKARRGRSGFTVTLAQQYHYARLSDMAS